jgi:hypothetical protein
MPRPSIVMVVLGTTIHEFTCPERCCPEKLVDGRTKSDHDGLGGMRILEATQAVARACSTWNTHHVTN